MFFEEIIAVYTENYTSTTIQNVALLTVKEDGRPTYPVVNNRVQRVKLVHDFSLTSALRRHDMLPSEVLAFGPQGEFVRRL
jgi:hypothetical protein